MKFKDYYETLGVPRNATQDDIKQAYRKLARKYHPDVSKMADAEHRFKELGEAHEVLKDPEKRAAYDEMGSQWKNGQEFQPPPNWDTGFEFTGSSEENFGQDTSDFFEALFGRHARRGHVYQSDMHAKGEDHHAKVAIDLQDAYRGAQRNIVLRMPRVDLQGHTVLQTHELNVNIPKGITAGQHLRLAGRGGPGVGSGPAGDLFLEIVFNPHPIFRIDGRDIYLDLPITPWEAALGASVNAPTPEGTVALNVPAGSSAGRKLRLKGKGIPGATPDKAPGDLYAILSIAVPPAHSDTQKNAYHAMAKAFDFNPRAHLKG